VKSSEAPARGLEPAGVIATWIATWFGCGFAPLAPGTAGSLGALLPAMLLVRYAGWRPIHFAALAVVLLGPAIWAAGRVARARGAKDPSLVVIDEVLGLWITLAGATILNATSWIAAFVVFRLLDICKPPPLRRLEALPGGVGIVADDIMAGIYGALVLFAAGCFNLY
jgi:phosphatidylglycerophosphatase A